MKQIGKYQVIRKLGQGATATVYLAFDPFAKREVAIKVASADVLKNPQQGKLYTRLFLNEASLVGKLSHPHIVQIFDAVANDNLFYIVMEYAPGGTLERHTEIGELLPVERVIEIIFKCSRALNFASRIGITHRDIKPANILFTTHDSQSADIKISDFGAAIIDTSKNTQITGVGSPAYMSPEQVRELPLNHQTDIYSLGIVMYQLLTGSLPFRGSSNYKIIYQILHEKPQKPSEVRPTLPKILDTIVERAMSKERDQRYQDWEELAHDLAQAFRSKSLAVPAQSFAETEQFDSLRKLAFFVGFSDVQIWEVLRFSEWRRVDAGQTVFQDGDHGDFFCFLTEGQLRVLKHNQVLNILQAGECFGEMAILGGESTRAADIVAISDSRIITVKDSALKRASEACRMHFYEAFLGVMSKRLDSANSKLAN